MNNDNNKNKPLYITQKNKIDDYALYNFNSK